MSVYLSVYLSTKMKTWMSDTCQWGKKKANNMKNNMLF